MNQKKGIVINRMYVGDYLSSNLGHEIINLFLADNGCHYLYLNAHGNFERKHKGNISHMLLVKSGPKDCFEVIGLAEGLEYVPGVELPRRGDSMAFDNNVFSKQKEFISAQPEGDVRYGGVSILDIFNESEQQSIFITFKAKKVLVPNDGRRIFLRYAKEAENYEKEDHTYIAIKGHNYPRTSLKSYVYPEDEGPDYSNIVKNLINKPNFWKNNAIKKVDVNRRDAAKEVSLFDICRIQNDENILSNALAYFIRQPVYYSIWKDFFSKFGVALNGPLNAEREVSTAISETYPDRCNPKNKGRIDLLLSDTNNIIVIENKIKSDINRVEHDPADADQLDRYKAFADQKYSSMNRYFFILVPNYQRLHLKDTKGFVLITYGDLHSHLNDPLYALYFQTDRNFKAFRDVIVRHTHFSANENLHDEMLEKFNARIKQLSQ